MPLYLLTDEILFPPPELSLENGLLAIGGDLSVERLLSAYRMGIFPWYSEGEPILWWSPEPRLILYPDDLRVSKSLRKIIRQNVFHLTMDTVFERVITACARTPRLHEQGTWITEDMIAAYCALHHAGYAHSVEAWQDGELAGGLYGISLGRCFFGESMFADKSNASKVALYALVQHIKSLQFDFIDCQVTSDHLLRLGAQEVLRDRFLSELKQAQQAPTIKGPWRFTADTSKRL